MLKDAVLTIISPAQDNPLALATGPLPDAGSDSDEDEPRRSSPSIDLPEPVMGRFHASLTDVEHEVVPGDSEPPTPVGSQRPHDGDLLL